MLSHLGLRNRFFPVLLGVVLGAVVVPAVVARDTADAEELRSAFEAPRVDPGGSAERARLFSGVVSELRARSGDVLLYPNRRVSLAHLDSELIRSTYSQATDSGRRNLLAILICRYALMDDPPAAICQVRPPDAVYQAVIDEIAEEEELTPPVQRQLMFLGSSLWFSGRAAEPDLRGFSDAVQDLGTTPLRNLLAPGKMAVIFDRILNGFQVRDGSSLVAPAAAMPDPPVVTELPSPPAPTPSPAEPVTPSPPSVDVVAPLPIQEDPSSPGSRVPAVPSPTPPGAPAPRPARRPLVVALVAFLLGLGVAALGRRRKGTVESPYAPPSSPIPDLPPPVEAAPTAAKIGPAHAETVVGSRPEAGPQLPSRYQDVTLLGAGGMGLVYRAHDRDLDRAVAVKVLSPQLRKDAALVERFRREAAALAKLDHPGIVRVYDVAAEPEPYMVMELLQGRGLDSILATRGPLEVAEVVGLGAAIADALEHAHSRGVIHRDLKPGNIFRNLEGEYKLLDFGLARLASAATITREDQTVGTALYMAPEQLQGLEVDARVDVYSLGATLYTALVGRPPFQPEAVFARVFRAPSPPSDARQGLSGVLDAPLARALAPRPEDRFPDAAALRTALLDAARRLDPTRQALGWVNVLLQANREVFHPLKSRLALVKRYPGDGARVVTLLSSGAVLDETRAGLRRASSFLELCGHRAGSEGDDLLAGVARLRPGLQRADEALAALSADTVLEGLAAGFEACRRFSELAAGLAGRHVVDLSAWAADLAAASPAGLTVEVVAPSSLELVAPDAGAAVQELSKVAEVLLSNAAEAGAGQVRLEVSSGAEPDSARLSFQDDGPGLPAGDPETLFAPGESRGKEGGTGMGLPDARRRVGTLGGTLTAHQGEGGGGRFVVEVPRRARVLPAGLPLRGGKESGASRRRRG